VLQGMTNKQVPWIAKVTLPMFFLIVAALSLIYAFPDLVLWLPRSMKGTG
jgi:C4-dicarboxylate transporter DctM subunit